MLRKIKRLKDLLASFHRLKQFKRIICNESSQFLRLLSSRALFFLSKLRKRSDPLALAFTKFVQYWVKTNPQESEAVIEKGKVDWKAWKAIYASI